MIAAVRGDHVRNGRWISVSGCWHGAWDGEESASSCAPAFASPGTTRTETDGEENQAPASDRALDSTTFGEASGCRRTRQRPSPATSTVVQR
jgi:hypothetical protein